MWQTMSNPSMIGPSLPPHLTAARSTKSDEGSDESSPQPVIGPQPPSTDEKKESSNKASYGPSLPPGMTYGPKTVRILLFTQIQRVMIVMMMMILLDLFLLQLMYVECDTPM